MLLVPRRDGIPERDDAWAWCKARWRSLLPEVEIIEGHHDDGPFNRSAAINRASALADEGGRWDVAVVIDSDIFVRASQARGVIERAHFTGRVTWAHRRWRGLHEASTRRILADHQDFGPEYEGFDMDLLVEKTNPLSWSCCIAIPRAVFDDLGGFDERFIGWGFEDMAFQSIVSGLYGYERLDGDVYHLWHPRSEERLGGRAVSPHYVTNARLGRRYMLAARRDHGVHDRATPSDAAEMERDIANLRHDDERLAKTAARLGLPDWSHWWPTLEELREGAGADQAGPDPTVTLVLTSGGTSESWPARSSYLAAALASLNENLLGPIVQRVLFSDWPDDLEGEVSAIAGAAGFYVVGGGHHGYTAMRQRLWSYLRRRAVGSYIFATEDDFTVSRPVDLVAMIATLQANPNLLQLALLRDAFYAKEREAGGILGWPRDQFENRAEDGQAWLEHRLFFTANPGLFRKALTERPWPSGNSSERLFGDAILRDAKARVAFWGDGSEPWVKHVGEVRAGAGY